MRFAVLLLVTGLLSSPVRGETPYFGIRVVDEATGRGVPLVQLKTVNDIAFVTDSAGIIAFNEPGLMGREVYFAVAGPGYEYPKDGFGFTGVRLTPKPGETATVKVHRTNIAERLYRVTGQGIYRDSELLALPTPMPNSKAGIVGQDSVQTVPYRGKLFWLWGDTNLAHYPLGNFHTTAATSPLPAKPMEGIALDYYSDQPDRVRRMMPVTEPGVVWLFGLLTVPDDRGGEILLSHFTRRKDLGTQLEHGIARFDDDAGIFKKIATFDLKNTWRHPRSNAVRHGDYYYFAAPLCHTRVKATLADVCDPNRYEAFSNGEWRTDGEPSSKFELRAADTQKSIGVHGGSVAWNPHRNRWILIALQRGERVDPSYIGEVWYAEAADITGPWGAAVKVASHPKYSFYNPRLHPYFDEAGGRFVYFEGTYTATFSGNQHPTPRYEYNQLMYRLDVDDARLTSTR